MTALSYPQITVIKGLFISITIGITMLLSGCAQVFLGDASDLTRIYETDYHQGIKASINVMEQLIFQRKEETADELKTIIEGHHNYDTPITIEVVFVEAGWTQIGVHTGYIGEENLQISKQVHENIAEELKRLRSRNLQATSQKRIKKTPVLQATSSKKRFKPPENEPRVSQVLYDDLPSPPRLETVSTPMENGTGVTQEMSERQEKQSPAKTESNDKTFTYYPKSALTIHSGSTSTLEDVIYYLYNNPSTTAEIRAYTDSSGNIDRNLFLSRKRVFEIRNYLILNGISEERITAQGLDTNNFLKDNPTERHGSLNHPVEITVR